MSGWCADVRYRSWKEASAGDEFAKGCASYATPAATESERYRELDLIRGLLRANLQSDRPDMEATSLIRRVGGRMVGGHVVDEGVLQLQRNTRGVRMPSR